MRQQGAQPLDDGAGTQVVALDVGQDLLQLRGVQPARLDHHLRRIGVGQDRRQRLVDLVGDRGRQFAGHRQPRRMQELRAVGLHAQLGHQATAPLHQQGGDQCRLRQHRQQHQRRLPAIPLQERRFSKPQCAAGRQVAAVQAEALQLPGIGHTGRGRRRLDQRSTVGRPRQRARQQVGDAFAAGLVRFQCAGRQAHAHLAFVGAVDRRGAAGADRGQGLARLVDMACGIAEQRHVEHDGVDRFARQAIGQRLGRRAGQHLHAQAVAVGQQRFTCAVQLLFVERGYPADHHHAARPRLQRERDAHGAGEVDRGRDAGQPGAGRQLAGVGGRHEVVDRGRLRPELLAEAEVEIDRWLGHQQDGIEAHPFVLAGQHLGQRRPGQAAEAQGVDRLVEPDHRSLKAPRHRRAGRTVDRDEGGEVGVAAGQHQHLRGRDIGAGYGLRGRAAQGVWRRRGRERLGAGRGRGGCQQAQPSGQCQQEAAPGPGRRRSRRVHAIRNLSHRYCGEPRLGVLAVGASPVGRH